MEDLELESDSDGAVSGPGAPFLGVASVIDGKPISLAVLDLATLEILLRIDLPEWNDFRASSANARLIERGYMPPPAAYYEPDAMAGWRPMGGWGYAVPLVSRDTLV